MHVCYTVLCGFVSAFQDTSTVHVEHMCIMFMHGNIHECFLSYLYMSHYIYNIHFYTCIQTLSTMQFDSLMSEVSSSDMLPEHGTVIAMHLLHQSRNLSKLRQHMEHLYKNGVGCLGSHIDRLVSTLVYIHIVNTV